MSLALSTGVLFVSLMKSENGAQFLNITFLPVLSETAAAATAAVFGTVLIPLHVRRHNYNHMKLTLALKF